MWHRTSPQRLMWTWAMLACVLSLVLGALAAPPARAEKWHTNPTGWWWLQGVSVEQIQAKIADGFRLIDLEVEQASPLRLSAVFVKNTGVHAKTWWWYYGQTAADVSTRISAHQARIIDIDTYWVDNQQRFAVVLVANSGAEAKSWWWYYNVSPDFISAKIDEHHARLVDIDTYVYNGVRYYTAVMIANSGADAVSWWWYYNVSPDFIKSKLQQHHARLIEIDKHNSDTFTVIMEASGGQHWWWYYGITEDQVNAFAGQNGARVFDIETYEVSGQKRFAALMLNNSNALTTEIGDLLRDNTDAVVGLYLKRVNGPVLASLQHTTRFYPASSIKVLEHLHAMRWVQVPIPGNPNPLLKLSTPIPVNTASCDNTGTPANESLSQALTLMMKNSDNDRANAVQDYFGLTAINTTAHTVAGMSANTQLNHKFGCGGPTNNPANSMTLVDVGQLYERAATGALLSPLYLTVFHDLMLNETNNYFISTTIDEEAAALGLSAADLAAFKAAVKMMQKGGSIPPSVDGKTYLSLAGWVGLPFKNGGQVALRGYVYGIFIDQATSVAANFGPDVAARELLRDEIHKALWSWKYTIGSVLPNQTSELASPDGKVMLIAPAGATDSAVDVLYEPLPAPRHPIPLGRDAGHAFVLEGLDAEGNAVAQLKQPYTLRITYASQGLALASSAENNLGIAYWYGRGWVMLPSQVDSANKQITATLDHFGEFALLSQGGTTIYLPAVLR